MHGSCLCAKVQYQIQGTLRQVVGCHCLQCRKTSGHHVAATQIQDENLTIQGGENITWFQSSPGAQRGFCKFCGSQLFWKETDTDNTSIMAGTLDGQTGLTMNRQLYPEFKGDYYSLPDAETVEQSSL